MPRVVTAVVTGCQAKTVTPAGTTNFRQCSIVPAMVTGRPKTPKQRRRPPLKIQPVRRHLYVREWRKFMGTKPIELAIALDIQRQSYHRLEKLWWTINAGEMDVIAKTIGIKPSQLWFPPPEKGQQERLTVDELMEDIPENMRPAAFMALRGMAGK